MNYDHTYHAGNFADVFKHIVLMWLAQKLQQKATPYCYIDTHAGYPFYDLYGALSQQGQETQQGIQRLWQTKLALSTPIQNYLSLITRFNEQKAAKHQFYPGSAEIMVMLKRPDDVVILNELHPTPYEALKKYYQGQKNIACHHQNAYQALKAFLPPKPNRGIVLIDPPFEAKDEFSQLTEGLKTALARWPNGIYAVWYPIKSLQLVNAFINNVQQNVTENFMDFRCCPWPADVSQRLSGSGMLIINPPWQIDIAINALARELEVIFKEMSS